MKVTTIKILTDNIEPDPTDDFQKLSDTIVSMIQGSEPRFSIGIYGDWGTGKTTLMKLVEKKLRKYDSTGENILTIWFNAWRYEREEQLATIALLKTIAFGMTNHPRYSNVAKSIWNGIKIITKDTIRQLTLQTILSEQGWDDLEKKLTDKMQLLNKIDQNTIYFDGIKTIEDELSKIRNDYSESKIVIFIDDLDRCSPKKVLEVLESIKVFLDMNGFVFILGLSERTIINLITREYDGSGIRGEDYIQKIIQLPIRTPLWNSEDIEKMIKSKISPKLEDPYNKIILENKSLIALAVSPNPRELKRFINNIIVALEVFSDLKASGTIKEDELIVLEALKSRWNLFYLDMMLDKDFRKEILGILDSPVGVKEYVDMQTANNRTEPITDEQKKVSELPIDLMNFLDDVNVRKNLLAIENWDIYRRVSETTQPKQKPFLAIDPVRVYETLLSDARKELPLPAFLDLTQNLEKKYPNQQGLTLELLQTEINHAKKSVITKVVLDKKITELEEKLDKLATELDKDKRRKTTKKK